MLNNAFISCVEDRADKNLIVVRARVKGDLALALGDVKEVASNASADYPFRAWVTREHLKAAMEAAVDKIDYNNFKDSVGEMDRHDAYMNVWVAMNRFGRERAAKPKARRVRLGRKVTR